jgi:nucleoside-diphosphate-sugar epimerase
VTRVLITGASGFVGRAVCERVLSCGMKVRGSHRSLSSQALVPPGVEKIQIPSVDHDTDWSHALAGVSDVIHLAGRVHITKDTAKDQLGTYREVNTAGTEQLARAAVNAGVRRFIYLSSVGVNGRSTDGRPFAESDAPHPHDAYSISKWEAEQKLRKIAKDSDLEIVIIRPPLVYGPGGPGNFMRLVRLIESGLPLPLASIQGRRSFIYVRNLVNAIVTCATHSDASGQTFLVSDGEDVSLVELVRRIAREMGSKARLCAFPPRLLRTHGQALGKSMDIDRLTSPLLVDSSKIRRTLSWVPPYSMEDGLRTTLSWYLNQPPA